MAKITKEHAQKAVTKLSATIKSGAKHEIAKIFHDNKLIAQFGICRGSKKDIPHDYVPEQLHLTKAQFMELVLCRISQSEWIALLIQKGIVEMMPKSLEADEKTAPRRKKRT